MENSYLEQLEWEKALRDKEITFDDLILRTNLVSLDGVLIKSRYCKISLEDFHYSVLNDGTYFIEVNQSPQYVRFSSTEKSPWRGLSFLKKQYHNGRQLTTSD